MVEVIPAILTNNFEDLQKKVQALEPLVKKVQIDIMDGVFVPGRTIQASDLKKLQTKLKLQIHLMARAPEVYIDDFAELNAVKEFIFHAETTKASEGIIAHCHEHGLKAGIAFNPETIVRSALKGLKIADLALVMTVHPGAQARPFLSAPLRKIAQIKKLNSKIRVGVDGGVSLDTCKLVVGAGADFLVVGSAVWKAKDIAQVLELLKCC